MYITRGGEVESRLSFDRSGVLAPLLRQPIVTFVNMGSRSLCAETTEVSLVAPPNFARQRCTQKCGQYQGPESLCDPEVFASEFSLHEVVGFSANHIP